MQNIRRNIFVQESGTEIQQLNMVDMSSEEGLILKKKMGSIEDRDICGRRWTLKRFRPHFEPPERFLSLTLAAGDGFLEDKGQTIETLRGVCQHDEERIHNKTMFEAVKFIQGVADLRESGSKTPSSQRNLSRFSEVVFPSG
ncbi:hypothetical protein B9Z55_023420 [Caenorhabditis nigoni]|uniref:Uncharacterized protein n=1 Tax=Caenorhabditis nigoni TaxID=1611254 RepID=A0A2G5SQ27_9PELO|nr:hypothetical protein B9Z55_023420 [Caenorhabditis nigoni]